MDARVAVLLPGQTAEASAIEAAFRLAGSDPRNLVVLVPVSRPNHEAEFAAGINSSALTLEIEEEARRRIDRLIDPPGVEPDWKVLLCARPFLSSALRLAIEQGSDVLAIPQGRRRSLYRRVLDRRARHEGLRIVTFENGRPR